MARRPSAALRRAVPALLASTRPAWRSALRTAGLAGARALHVVAVHRDHERHLGGDPPHRVAARDRVVGVDELEGELAPDARAARAAAPARPTRPTCRSSSGRGGET